MLHSFYIGKKPQKYSIFIFFPPCKYARLFPISLNMQPFPKIPSYILINHNIIESNLLYRIHTWIFLVKIQTSKLSHTKTAPQKSICGLTSLFCCQFFQWLVFGWIKFLARMTLSFVANAPILVHRQKTFFFPHPTMPTSFTNK